MKHIASSISKLSIPTINALCQQEYAHNDKEQWQLDKERRALARQLRLRVRKKLAPQERFKQYQYKILDTVLAIGHETKQQYIFLDYLFGQFAQYPSGGSGKGLYKSQRVMAAESGVPLKSISDTIQKLKRAKVIKTMKRGRRTRTGVWARTTNSYVLNDYLMDPLIVSFLKPLYPSLEACLQPNHSGNYKKVFLYNYIHRRTDVREIPTFNEFYKNQKTKQIISFVGQTMKRSPKNNNKVADSTCGVKKRTKTTPNCLQQLQKRDSFSATSSLNGTMYDALSLEDDSMFAIKERRVFAPKKNIQKPEPKPPYHEKFKPNEQRRFGESGFTHLPQEQNMFLKMFPPTDNCRRTDEELSGSNKSSSFDELMIEFGN